MSNKGNASVPPQWSTQEKRFGETIKQNLDVLQGNRGNKLDRAVTFRDLLDTGIVRLASGVTNFNGNTSSVAVVNEIPNLEIPPAPTNLQASGAFRNIILTWDLQTYTGHSFVQVWRHTSDVISSATMVAQVAGFTGVYSDAVGPGATFYYWVRAINQNGVPGPFNSSTGTQGATSPDVTFLLNALTGAITSSELATALATEISDATTNITSLQNTYGSTASAAASAAAAAASQAAALLNQQGAETAEDNAVIAKTAAETAEAAAAVSETNSANSATGAAGSASTAATHASTAATAATNASNSASAASTQASNAAASATASSQSATASDTAKTAAETAKSAAETAETNAATSESNAAGSASSASTSATNAANSANAAGASASAANTDASAASSSATAAGQSATAASGSQSAASTSAANAAASETNAAQSETNAAGSATAAASTVNGLTARLNDVNNTGSGGAVTVEEAYSVTASNAGDITDLEGQYSVKIDNNGHVSGFGLSSTTTTSGPTSAFIIRADRFAIIDPSSTANGLGTTSPSTDTVPFVYQSATTLNGVSVPAGVYMRSAFIENGSIVNAKIGNAAIDDAKIHSLNASKITAGKINTSRLNIDGATITSSVINGVATLIVNEISANKVTSGTIATSLLDLDGSTISANASGQIQIKDLGVDTLKIAGNAVTIPSSAYTTSEVSNTTAQTITWTSSGAPTFVAASWTQNGSGQYGNYSGTVQIKYGSTVLWTQTLPGDNGRNVQRAVNISFTPSAGSATVTLVCVGSQYKMKNRSLFALETKK